MNISTENIPFYWSCRRRNLFRTCKRWYFLSCYGSWGGNDCGAAPDVREYHRLKRLSDKKEYLNALCSRILRGHFYRRQSESLPRLAANRLRWEFEVMRSYSPIGDHNVPMLKELAETPAAFGQLERELKSALAERITLCADGFYKELDRIPVLDRVELPCPLETALGELACYTNVPLVFRQYGNLCFVDSADVPENALLHRYCAMARFGLPPEAVVSYHLQTDSGTLRRFDNALNVSELLRNIRQDVNEMRSLIREDGSADSADFAAAPGTHCANCPFSAVCS